VPAASQRPQDNSQEAARSDDELEDSSTLARRSGWLRQFSKSYGSLILLGATCLVLGFMTGNLINNSKPPQESQVLATPAIPASASYLASTSRRHEPISPLAPFLDLDPNIVELGKRLFHDPSLSGDGRTSCASCHSVSAGGEDGQRLSMGVSGKPAQFNTPTVLNAAYNVAQHWDGRTSSLEDQIDVPITDPNQMDSNWERVVKYLENNRSYRQAFKNYLSSEPTAEGVKEAIATYERSLITVDSDFDRWLKGEEQALDADEMGGYFLFKKMNCISCHHGAGLGGNRFHAITDMAGYFPSQLPEGRYSVTKNERDRQVLRVPQLRNVALTAPYFHDGSAGTLEEAVAAMIEFECGQKVNAEDVRRLTAFLNALTGQIPE
jgi:cytochrome c peroxidase